MICPKLEELELDIDIDEEDLDIWSMIEMTEARASRGAKLRTVRIFDRNVRPRIHPADVLELGIHVWNVEYCPEAGGSPPPW